MADRKVLVRYYPPDFDPVKLREKSRQYRHVLNKKKKPPGGVKQMNVRFMFPFTLCCSTCGEFVYIGTKFNSRVERVVGEDYLGIAIWRFYGRCPHCRAEIAFKTDPKNTEYVLEFGGTRTYDSKKDAQLAENTLKDQLEEEIATDSMRALEHKTYSTANELMALEQLDELRKINKRLLNRESTVDDALQWLKQGGVEKEEEEGKGEGLDELDDEDLEDFERAKEEISRRQLEATLGHSSGSDEDGHDHHEILENNRNEASASSSSKLNEADESQSSSSSSSSSTLLNSKPSLLIKKRVSPSDDTNCAAPSSKRTKTEAIAITVNEASVGVSLLGQYDSSGDDDGEDN